MSNPTAAPLFLTESHIDRLLARIDGSPLAVKLTWRQRVIDALTAKKAEHAAQMDAAAIKADDDGWEKASAHFHAVSSFLYRSKMGGNWKQWLYLVPVTPAELADLA